MTTFTTEDREKATQDVSITVDPLPPILTPTEVDGGIPLIWKQEDKEDTEKMLREQLRMQNEEILRLRRKIRELEQND